MQQWRLCGTLKLICTSGPFMESGEHSKDLCTYSGSTLREGANTE